MFPIIDKRKTGINLRRIMDERGLTVKDDAYEYIQGINGNLDNGVFDCSNSKYEYDEKCKHSRMPRAFAQIKSSSPAP